MHKLSLDFLYHIVRLAAVDNVFIRQNVAPESRASLPSLHTSNLPSGDNIINIRLHNSGILARHINPSTFGFFVFSNAFSLSFKSPLGVSPSASSRFKISRLSDSRAETVGDFLTPEGVDTSQS